VVFVIIFS